MVDDLKPVLIAAAAEGSYCPAGCYQARSYRRCSCPDLAADLGSSAGLAAVASFAVAAAACPAEDLPSSAAVG